MYQCVELFFYSAIARRSVRYFTYFCSVVSVFAWPRRRAIRAYIDTHIPPPNSPVTVNGGWIWNRKARKGVYVSGKGFDKPLFDTGALYDAFGYEISEE